MYNQVLTESPGKIGISILLTSILLFSNHSLLASGQAPPSTSCEILVDWDYHVDWLDEPNEEDEIYTLNHVHRYKVIFHPQFGLGESPSAISVSSSQVRHASGENIPVNVSYISAGGEVDIELDTDPEFQDKILVNFSSTEALCSRTVSVTNWNQPIEDHEITRETLWSLEGTESEGQSIEFMGRGWQKRAGPILESNELGNGSLRMNTMNGTNGIILDLDLDRIWLNESYDGNNLISQDFEMLGNGSMFLSEGNSEESFEEGFSAQISVTRAVVNRSWNDGSLTERILIEGGGWLSFSGGDNESSEGGFGQIENFYFESFDENGLRRMQNFHIDANASLRILGGSDYFSFELDDLIIRERWSDDTREEQFFRAYGQGDFGFEIRDDEFNIDVNGTIPLVHIESNGGETVSDTILVDGTYDGDIEGSFGLVRQIVDSGVQQNSEGVPYEVDKIQNEFWWNVSATPFGPISQEWGAEHNLTYEFVAPQQDWLNRTVRLQYVEDNGTISDEFPPDSPIIVNPSRPQASPLLSNQISRESGVSPSVVVPGDFFTLFSNPSNILEVGVLSTSEKEMDGHLVKVAEWAGNIGSEGISASGFFVNEGPLSGLLYEANRWISLTGEEDDPPSGLTFMEYQKVDRVLYPTVITEDENSLPSLLSVSFREGFLHTEGGVSHIEVMIEDIDTDVISVTADLSSIGLGMVTLSDSGLLGDMTISDDVWTCMIFHEGLEFGQFTVPVIINDYWTQVTDYGEITVENLPPRANLIILSDQSAYRGQTLGISVDSVDGHGVDSVSVDLLSVGGELYNLSYSESTGFWSGEFTIPYTIPPGERIIPIRMSDTQGAEIFSNNLVEMPVLEIINEFPSLISLEIWKEGTPLTHKTENGDLIHPVMVSSNGGKIAHHIEVEVSDPDGVSSVQAIIGRLADIGKSEQWLLLVDDGTSGDRVAGDGIFTLFFEARSTIPEGELEIKIRATDIFVSSTPPENQGHILSVQHSECCDGESSWMSQNFSSVVLIASFSILLIGMATVILQIRKSDFD